MILRVEDDFDLDRIAESGQCFRWQRLETGGYRIPHGRRCLRIRPAGEGRFDLDCGGDALDGTWRAYFDLDESYRAIRARIDPDDACLLRAAEAGRGIHILRQDPWETLVTFLISQNRNIPSIRRSVLRLAELGGGDPFGAFPAPEDVLRMGEEGLRACSLGYRTRYVLDAARQVSSGRLDLAALTGADGGAAEAALRGVCGVGEKVAACVALFGLHQLNAFPVDVWITRVLREHYPDGFPFARYAPYCGVYQQYLFAWRREEAGR